GAAASAHVDNLLRIPDCRIVAAVSRKKERAQEFLLGKNLPAASAYGRLSTFLEHEDLDVVTICTPHPNHPAEAIACARAGKHIIIEKPVALRQQDLTEMVRAVNRANVRTSVCFELHWIGLFENIMAMLRKKMIGDIFMGEVSYFHGIGPHIGQFAWNIRKNMGGNALLTAGCHALDALIYFMGSRVVEVAAMGNTSTKNPWGYQYDPNNLLLLRFENGALGKVGTSIECRQPYMFPVMLMGDRGTIVNDRFTSLDFPGQKGFGHIPTDLPESGLVDDHPYRAQFEEFFAAVRADRDPHNSLHRAAHVHEVIFAAETAMKTKRTVRVKKTPGT
ncbi:MAG TPA: Gfo/Idh/MocA family oxidoreductase, partial [Planctomycetota bacterium]|nr:Gfo/Idh/MocA family oxidoreductase [Planctomycetota bacterium]